MTADRVWSFIFGAVAALTLIVWGVWRGLVKGVEKGAW